MGNLGYWAEGWDCMELQLGQPWPEWLLTLVSVCHVPVAKLEALCGIEGKIPGHNFARAHWQPGKQGLLPKDT